MLWTRIAFLWAALGEASGSDVSLAKSDKTPGSPISDQQITVLKQATLQADLFAESLQHRSVLKIPIEKMIGMYEDFYEELLSILDGCKKYLETARYSVSSDEFLRTESIFLRNLKSYYQSNFFLYLEILVKNGNSGHYNPDGIITDDRILSAFRFAGVLSKCLTELLAFKTLQYYTDNEFKLEYFYQEIVYLYEYIIKALGGKNKFQSDLQRLDEVTSVLSNIFKPVNSEPAEEYFKIPMSVDLGEEKLESISSAKPLEDLDSSNIIINCSPSDEEVRTSSELTAIPIAQSVIKNLESTKDHIDDNVDDAESSFAGFFIHTKAIQTLRENAILQLERGPLQSSENIEILVPSTLESFNHYLAKNISIFQSLFSKLDANEGQKAIANEVIFALSDIIDFLNDIVQRNYTELVTSDVECFNNLVDLLRTLNPIMHKYALYFNLIEQENDSESSDSSSSSESTSDSDSESSVESEVEETSAETSSSSSVTIHSSDSSAVEENTNNSSYSSNSDSAEETTNSSSKISYSSESSNSEEDESSSFESELMGGFSEYKDLVSDIVSFGKGRAIVKNHRQLVHLFKVIECGKNLLDELKVNKFEAAARDLEEMLVNLINSLAHIIVVNKEFIKNYFGDGYTLNSLKRAQKICAILKIVSTLSIKLKDPSDEINIGPFKEVKSILSAYCNRLILFFEKQMPLRRRALKKASLLIGFDLESYVRDNNLEYDKKDISNVDINTGGTKAFEIFEQNVKSNVNLGLDIAKDCLYLQSFLTKGAALIEDEEEDKSAADLEVQLKKGHYFIMAAVNFLLDKIIKKDYIFEYFGSDFNKDKFKKAISLVYAFNEMWHPIVLYHFKEIFKYGPVIQPIEDFLYKRIVNFAKRLENSKIVSGNIKSDFQGSEYESSGSDSGFIVNMDFDLKVMNPSLYRPYFPSVKLGCLEIPVQSSSIRAQKKISIDIFSVPAFSILEKQLSYPKRQVLHNRHIQGFSILNHEQTVVQSAAKFFMQRSRKDLISGPNIMVSSYEIPLNIGNPAKNFELLEPPSSLLLLHLNNVSSTEIRKFILAFKKFMKISYPESQFKLQTTIYLLDGPVKDASEEYSGELLVAIQLDEFLVKLLKSSIKYIASNNHGSLDLSNPLFVDYPNIRFNDAADLVKIQNQMENLCVFFPMDENIFKVLGTLFAPVIKNKRHAIKSSFEDGRKILMIEYPEIQPVKERKHLHNALIVFKGDLENALFMRLEDQQSRKVMIKKELNESFSKSNVIQDGRSNLKDLYRLVMPLIQQSSSSQLSHSKSEMGRNPLEIVNSSRWTIVENTSSADGLFSMIKINEASRHIKHILHVSKISMPLLQATKGIHRFLRNLTRSIGTIDNYSGDALVKVSPADSRRQAKDLTLIIEFEEREVGKVKSLIGYFEQLIRTQGQKLNEKYQRSRQVQEVQDEVKINGHKNDIVILAQMDYVFAKENEKYLRHIMKIPRKPILEANVIEENNPHSIKNNDVVEDIFGKISYDQSSESSKSIKINHIVPSTPINEHMESNIPFQEDQNEVAKDDTNNPNSKFLIDTPLSKKIPINCNITLREPRTNLPNLNSININSPLSVHQYSEYIGPIYISERFKPIINSHSDTEDKENMAFRSNENGLLEHFANGDRRSSAGENIVLDETLLETEEYKENRAVESSKNGKLPSIISENVNCGSSLEDLEKVYNNLSDGERIVIEEVKLEKRNGSHIGNQRQGSSRNDESPSIKSEIVNDSNPLVEKAFKNGNKNLSDGDNIVIKEVGFEKENENDIAIAGTKELKANIPFEGSSNEKLPIIKSESGNSLLEDSKNMGDGENIVIEEVKFENEEGNNLEKSDHMEDDEKTSAESSDEKLPSKKAENGNDASSLLKDIENRDNNLPDGENIDIKEVKREGKEYNDLVNSGHKEDKEKIIIERIGNSTSLLEDIKNGDKNLSDGENIVIEEIKREGKEYNDVDNSSKNEKLSSIKSENGNDASSLLEDIENRDNNLPDGESIVIKEVKLEGKERDIEVMKSETCEEAGSLPLNANSLVIASSISSSKSDGVENERISSQNEEIIIEEVGADIDNSEISVDEIPQAHVPNIVDANPPISVAQVINNAAANPLIPEHQIVIDDAANPLSLDVPPPMPDVPPPMPDAPVDNNAAGIPVVPPPIPVVPPPMPDVPIDNNAAGIPVVPPPIPVVPPPMPDVPPPMPDVPPPMPDAPVDNNAAGIPVVPPPIPVVPPPMPDVPVDNNAAGIPVVPPPIPVVPPPMPDVPVDNNAAGIPVVPPPMLVVDEVEEASAPSDSQESLSLGQREEQNNFRRIIVQKQHGKSRLISPRKPDSKVNTSDLSPSTPARSRNLSLLWWIILVFVLLFLLSLGVYFLIVKPVKVL